MNSKFKESKENPCVYIRESIHGKVIGALDVDDGLITPTCHEDLDLFISEKFHKTSFEFVLNSNLFLRM